MFRIWEKMNNMQIFNNQVKRQVRAIFICEILMPEKEFIQIYGADQTLYEDVEDIDAGARWATSGLNSKYNHRHCCVTFKIQSPPVSRENVNCKTVGFFSKSVKKSVKRGVRVLRARSARVWGESLALRCQPRSRPFVWLLAYTWNTDCFAV